MIDKNVHNLQLALSCKKLKDQSEALHSLLFRYFTSLKPPYIQNQKAFHKIAFSEPGRCL